MISHSDATYFTDLCIIDNIKIAQTESLCYKYVDSMPSMEVLVGRGEPAPTVLSESRIRRISRINADNTEEGLTI